MKTHLRLGNITEYAKDYDAIVNAANETLLGGGGVDGAIHRAAGEELLYECIELGGCKTGEAKVTGAYRLASCKNIIHTVGPIYNENEPEKCDILLFKAYLSCLEQAMTHKLQKIAFPSISTGIYHFPIERAATIAKMAAYTFSTLFPEKDLDLTWVLFTQEDYEVYKKVFHE